MFVFGLPGRDLIGFYEREIGGNGQLAGKIGRLNWKISLVGKKYPWYTKFVIKYL